MRRSSKTTDYFPGYYSITFSPKEDDCLPEKDSHGWQLCPKCRGDGELYRYSPPNISSGTIICDICKGKKIISVITGLPPQAKIDQI